MDDFGVPADDHRDITAFNTSSRPSLRIASEFRTDGRMMFDLWIALQCVIAVSQVYHGLTVHARLAVQGDTPCVRSEHDGRTGAPSEMHGHGSRFDYGRTLMICAMGRLGADRS